MIRFVADENLNDFIVCGLLRRRPDLDIVRLRDTSMRKAGDPAVLEWAIEEIILIAECSLEGEWEGQVRHLPLQ